MTELLLTPELEASFCRETVLPDLPVSWADELVGPAYPAQRSLVSVAHSVAAALGASLADSRALPIDRISRQSVDRVVLFLLDGLGYQMLRDAVAFDPSLADIIAELNDSQPVAMTSSIVPSTTAVALPSLWTATTPGISGMFGSTMLLPEVGQRVGILKFAPSDGPSAHDIIENIWDITAEDIIAAPSLAQHLQQAGITTYNVGEKLLFGTGLSKFLHRGYETSIGHWGYAEKYRVMRDHLCHTRDQRSFSYIYLGDIDKAAHDFGAAAEAVLFSVEHILRMLRDILRDASVHNGRTLFMMTADHGHRNLLQPFDVRTDKALRPLRDRLLLPLSGDARHTILHLVPGTLAEVQQFFAEQLADWFACIPSNEAVASGLYGPTHLPPRLRVRLGDAIVLARPGAALADSHDRFGAYTSIHGGLSREEMLTPLLLCHG